jgi:tetratricopeptide (TPR) repeat protein
MAAKSSCSGCGREHYCGSDCQKLDWKVHKSTCPFLKKLSNTLQPYNDVVRIIDDILASKTNKSRVLEHLLSYAEYQFGKPVVGKKFRERSDGQRIANWNVDIAILLDISNKLVNIYSKNSSSLSSMIRDKEIFPHLERSLHILSPWMITIDTDATNQSNGLDHLLMASFRLEQSMAITAMSRNQYDVAEGHCHRCIVNSRRISGEGDDKTTATFEALGMYIRLRQSQGEYSSAVTFAEEAYFLVVEAYDPVHPQVQEAAGWLIDCLIKKGDLLNAERFAEQTYANLRDIKNGMDQEGEQIAQGAYNLADVIFLQVNGDLIKAEGLARDAIRIKVQLFDAYDNGVGGNYLQLARILLKQGKFDDETKELYEHSLASFIRNEGLDGGNTAFVNITIGEFYYQLALRQSILHTKRTQLLLAKSYSEEAIRIETKIHIPTHPNRAAAASLLSAILIELSRV